MKTFATSINAVADTSVSLLCGRGGPLPQLEELSEELDEVVRRSLCGSRQLQKRYEHGRLLDFVASGSVGASSFSIVMK